MPELTEAEKIFVSRMVPHIVAGLTFDAAATAVIADDQRIWLETMEDSETGQAIRAELCGAVHAAAVSRG